MEGEKKDINGIMKDFSVALNAKELAGIIVKRVHEEIKSLDGIQYVTALKMGTAEFSKLLDLEVKKYLPKAEPVDERYDLMLRSLVSARLNHDMNAVTRLMREVSNEYDKSDKLPIGHVEEVVNCLSNITVVRLWSNKWSEFKEAVEMFANVRSDVAPAALDWMSEPVRQSLMYLIFELDMGEYLKYMKEAYAWRA